MMPRWHILFGFVFSYSLVCFFKFSLTSGIIVFLSTIFIDLDHVLLFFLETKSLSPRKFFSHSINKKNKYLSLTQDEKKSFKKPHFLFHGLEFVILLIILSKFNTFFLWVLIGVFFHLILDFFALIYEREHISVKTSQIWLWQRNKNKKRFAFK